MRPVAVHLFLVVALLRCASSPATDAHAQLQGVTITFDHFSAAVDVMSQRMVEEGQAVEGSKSGTDYWLRFENRSSQTISFSTMSTYMKQPIEWIDIGEGQRVIALADGAHIAVRFGVESRRGSDLPVGGGDMFWVSHLPSGRHALFSVPKRALARGQRLYIDYTPIGSPSASYRVYFTPHRDP